MNQKYVKMGLIAGLIAGFVFVLSAMASGTAATNPAPQPEPDTMVIPADAPILFLEESAGRVNPALDASLQALAEAAAFAPDSVAGVAADEGLTLVEGRVQVVVLTDNGRAKDARAAISAVGGEVTKMAYENTLVQAWVPADQLAQVAKAQAIDFVRSPAEVTLFETEQALQATTEGLAAMNVPEWHAAGYQGQGVKIAIIDGGFTGYTSLLGTDLPSSVTAKNFVDGQSDGQVNGTSPHGTACAEIVHDVAPQAQLYLLKVNTEIDLEEAVDYAIGQGVDVISTSLGWYNVTPGDGTGFFSNLVNRARSNGIVWTTAAGNDRQLHWGGAFNDTDADTYHNFGSSQDPVNYFGPGNGQAYLFPAGSTLRVFLRWDDWGSPTQDYALSLFRYDGSQWVEIKRANNTQNGQPGQTPTEIVVAQASGANTAYGFTVQRVSSNRNVALEIFAPKVAPRMDKLVNARTLSNLADSPNAITVAALDVSSPYPQESYSGEGPTNGPGGTIAGGIIKPDLAGFANVSTSAYGAGAFNGTSSATPHVAGAMALVLSAQPAFSPQQVADYLFARAKDMGANGRDNQYGYGRVHLGTPPTNSTATPIAPTVTPTRPPINVVANAFVPITLANAVGMIPPTTTPSSTGSLEVVNSVGGDLRVELVGYSQQVFSPGTSRWDNIPAKTYTVKVTALSGPCSGGSLEDRLQIDANRTTQFVLECNLANQLEMNR